MHFTPVHVKCLASLILHDFLILTIFDKEYWITTPVMGWVDVAGDTLPDLFSYQFMKHH
jgi:hypothetical protein